MNQGGKSYWLNSGFYTIAQRLSTQVFNLGSLYWLYRLFSKEEMGVWSLFLLVSAIVETARSGLIQNAIVRHLSIADKSEHPAIITSSFTLNLILSGITMLLLCFGGHYLANYVLKAPQLELMFYFYLITTMLLLPFFQFQYIQQANLDFKGVFWGMFCRQGLFFTIVTTMYWCNYKPSLINLVHLQSLAALLAACVGFAYAKKYTSFSLKIHKEWLLKLFNFGKFGFITNLSSIVSGSIDQALLSNLLNPGAVALQSTALKITNAVEVPTNALADIVFPQSARRMHEDGANAVKLLYEKSVGAIMAVIIPFLALVALLPNFIISILTKGGEYLEAVGILQITLIYTAIIPFDRQAGTILDSTGRQKLNFYLQIFFLVLNFFTNYLFISKFGLLGAAYGSLATYLVSFISKQILLNRFYGISTLEVFKYALGFYREMPQIILKKLKRG